MGAAGAQDAVVNERLPADRAALERHWALDCSEAVDAVRTLAAGGTACSPASLPAEREASIASDLARCAVLDRRESVAAGRHGRLYEAFRRWREAAAEGRDDDAAAFRRGVSAVLDTEF